jgi:hypothetical protein
VEYETGLEAATPRLATDQRTNQAAAERSPRFAA